jgi:hypothetical protein
MTKSRSQAAFVHHGIRETSESDKERNTGSKLSETADGEVE